MKEYDIVELINDRERYLKEGAKKGMFGVIMCDLSIDGCWYVIFSEFYTGNDIADISVKEEDLIVHKSFPPDRIPPPPDLRKGG